MAWCECLHLLWPICKRYLVNKIMTNTLTKDLLSKSLRDFKSRRDSLLHSETNVLEHHLDRFIQFIENDFLAKQVMESLDVRDVDTKDWWASVRKSRGKLSFPSVPDEELSLRYALIQEISQNSHGVIYQLSTLAGGFGGGNNDERTNLVLDVIIRPFCEEFGHRIAEVADLASPEARELQAVPMNRIPTANETRIFLSHKTVDKQPLVRRYCKALEALGYEPWLDEDAMPAGSEVERGILDGFKKSCAAVFFITENFSDERYLAAEINYAIMQKRQKDKKFSIITLRYSTDLEIPELLTPYVFRDVDNDLDGLYEIVRALPVELGPMRWKEHVVRS